MGLEILPEIRREYTLRKSGGSGIADGDKGEITVSSGGATWIIDDDVIDNANIATNASIEWGKISK